MPTYKERKRLADLARRESAGESFWTQELSKRTRTKVLHAIDLLTSDGNRWGQDPLECARARVVRDEGMNCLVSINFRVHDDIYEGIRNLEEDLVLSIVEALVSCFRTCANPYREDTPGCWSQVFASLVNQVFVAERFAAEIVGEELVPFSSRELHVEVVEPTLTLLAGRDGWGQIEAAYQDALREIAADHPADAITDAGRSLQLALGTIGAEGNSLGPLIKSAKVKGLLAPHDSKLLDGIESLMHWVSADRSETGEAHKAGTEDRSDAWLAVHVVGALLLRLAAETQRRA